MTNNSDFYESKDATQLAQAYQDDIFKGQKYDIDFIGDIKSSYSEKVILGSDVEAVALARHMRWGDENATDEDIFAACGMLSTAKKKQKS